jgi:hypothetical protein
MRRRHSKSGNNPTSFVHLLVSNSFVKLWRLPKQAKLNPAWKLEVHGNEWNLVDPLEGGTLSKQPADLRSLETALFWAREIAEELEEVAVLYFIDMAIAEAKMKSPPTANNHEP